MRGRFESALPILNKNIPKNVRQIFCIKDFFAASDKESALLKF